MYALCGHVGLMLGYCGTTLSYVGAMLSYLVTMSGHLGAMLSYVGHLLVNVFEKLILPCVFYSKNERPMWPCRGYVEAMLGLC